MNRVVIVGAGFGGLTLALELERAFKKTRDTELILVDAQDYLLFTPNLYEVAAAEEELESIKDLKASIALPITDVLKGRKIKFIKGQLNLIEQEKKRITVGKKWIDYDYLILAIGSQNDFFNTPGAEENALTLKSFKDALRLKNQLEFTIQLHRQDRIKKNINIAVVGGGYSGVEIAGELAQVARFIAIKNQYPKEKIGITIIESQNTLINGFDPRLSRDIRKRLISLGVELRLLEPVEKVDEHNVYLLSGEKFAYDVLVWTAGVRAKSLTASSQFAQDKKGRLRVNEHLQVQDYIFAIGDLAGATDTNGHLVPFSFQDAWYQFRYLAKALPKLFKNQKPEPYIAKKHGYIVSCGGKWAILSHKQFYIKGFLAYAIARLEHLFFFKSLIGWRKAFKLVYFQTRLYSRND